MKIAVIGSRDFKNKELFDKIMDKEFTNLFNTMVTGGARGVDTWAIEWSKKDCVYCEVIRPINPANKLDYLFRNIEIITKADKILVFWDGKSKGTKFVIDYAKARNKDMEVFKEG